MTAVSDCTSSFTVMVTEAFSPSLTESIGETSASSNDFSATIAPSRTSVTPAWLPLVALLKLIGKSVLEPISSKKVSASTLIFAQVLPANSRSSGSVAPVLPPRMPILAFSPVMTKYTQNSMTSYSA